MRFLKSLISSILRPFGRRENGRAAGEGQSRWFVYVANAGDNTVSIIDSTKGAVVATVKVGNQPHYIAMTPNGAYAYVTNSASMDVSVIDTAANTVIATVQLSGQPVGIAITPDGSRAYITLPNNNLVALLSVMLNGVLAYIPVNGRPYQVAITPDGKYAYVSCWDLDAVSIIDTAIDTVVNTVPIAVVGGHASGVAITPGGAHAYVGTPGWANIAQIEIPNNNKVNMHLWFNGGVAQIFPVAVTPLPPRIHVYAGATWGNDGTVNVISDQDFTLVDTLTVEPWPGGIAMTPNGATGYVTCIWADLVRVIDLVNVRLTPDRIPVGKRPYGVAIRAG